MRTKISRALLALAIIAVTSCSISSVVGPSLVLVGSSAVYQVNLSLDPSPGLLGFLAADFPVGWTLTSATYSGTINGAPASGAATVSASNPSACTFLPPAAGNQQQYLSAGPFTTVSGDAVTVTVTFGVAGAVGLGSVTFTLAAETPPPLGICNLANTVTVPVTTASAVAVPAASPLANVLLGVVLALVGLLALKRLS